jgi:pimeloyl-ACP methyl ester carboxylesterase
VSRFIYLHGFASGPSSKKARFFRERFVELGIGLEVPDLTGGNFQGLTISGQLAVIERAARGDQVSLIGSSMGGYLAALYAARHAEVEKLVLLAPAFSFLSRWPETLGSKAMEQWKRSGILRIFNYAQVQEADLGYQLIEDARKYEAYPDIRQPTLIFHGNNDIVVPTDLSVTFAARHPNVDLHVLNSDHELANVLYDMWMETEAFLF